MLLPENISEVSALEEDLRESGFSPNDYLPVTIGMKCLLHDHHYNSIEEFETLMRKKLEQIFELIKVGAVISL